MRITLIKSGIYPNPKSDQEVHSFTYSLYPHKGDWRTGKTIDEAYGLNCPLYSKLEKAHKGYLPKHFSMISVDKENVIVEAIKQAEDSGDIVIRMYEGYNRRSTVTATLCNNIEYVVECNLLEEAIDILKIHENQFSFVIKPFEIKTFKIRLKDKVR
jgi:alpha-mannosidase